MFITRKRYEAELEKARKEGAEKVWQERHNNDRFAEIHQRIDRLCEGMAQIEKKISQPNRVGFETGERKC